MEQIDTLEREQASFDSQLDALMKEHAGEFVVFHDGSPQGFFQSFDQAYRAGLDRFGLEGVFLVSQVAKRAPETTSISWLTGVIFGGS